jgi:hypothetical protein
MAATKVAQTTSAAAKAMATVSRPGAGGVAMSMQIGSAGPGCWQAGLVQNELVQKCRARDGPDLGRLELDWIEPLGCS